MTDLRKHMAWYFKGFVVGGERVVPGRVRRWPSWTHCWVRSSNQQFPPSSWGSARPPRFTASGGASRRLAGRPALRFLVADAELEIGGG